MTSLEPPKEPPRPVSTLAKLALAIVVGVTVFLIIMLVL